MDFLTERHIRCDGQLKNEVKKGIFKNNYRMAIIKHLNATTKL